VHTDIAWAVTNLGGVCGVRGFEYDSKKNGHVVPPCHRTKRGLVCASVKAVVGLGSLTLSDGVWTDPQRRLSVQ
jgi:hypothetical protein